MTTIKNTRFEKSVMVSITRNQKIWGPVVRRLLHLICYRYRDTSTLNDTEKDLLNTFIYGLCYVMPCKHCSVTYTAFLEIDSAEDVIAGGKDLFFWSYALHERVNKKLW